MADMYELITPSGLDCVDFEEKPVINLGEKN